MEERRKNPRLNVSFPVECSLLTKKDYFYTVSKDISASGAKILTNDFVAKNQMLKLNINFIDKVLGLKGTVIWCNREPALERYSAGVKFEELNEEDRKYLSSFAG